MIAVVTSSSENTPWAKHTIQNKAEYCRKHGYTLIARNLPYSQAVKDFNFLSMLLFSFETIWTLDADAIITNTDIKIEEIDIANGMNVCEEGIRADCRLNCGSVIWRGLGAISMIGLIENYKNQWKDNPFVWQSFINNIVGIPLVMPLLKIHSIGTFNSCHHGQINNWKPGHFVYHPCGGINRTEMCLKILGEIKQC